MNKRISCRAIIFDSDNILIMHRNKNGKEYYTYPGGGLEENESLEDCVKREVKEEFGIEISPIRELYEYETEDSLQHFFLCEWIDGQFGSGQGEEMNGNNPANVYEPVMVNANKMNEIILYPGKITSLIIDDYNKFSTKLGKNIKIVKE